MSTAAARWARRARAPRPALSDLDRYEVWRTPGTLVEQGLWATRILGRVVRARRIADLGAGSGPFGQRARRVWPGAHQVALEIRGEELPHLRRHYDEVIVGDMFAAAAATRLARFAPDLIVANPPYSHTLAALLLALSVVAVRGHVLFFVRGTFGSSAAAYQQLINHPPVHEFSIAGRPHLRHGRAESGAKLGGDFVPHTWLLFERTAAPTPCLRRWLPPLAADDLAWTVPPGTERTTPEFPPIYLPHTHTTPCSCPPKTPTPSTASSNTSKSSAHRAAAALPSSRRSSTSSSASRRRTP